MPVRLRPNRVVNCNVIGGGMLSALGLKIPALTRYEGSKAGLNMGAGMAACVT